MTLEQLKSVRMGMTRPKVARLIGCDGEIYSRWRSATLEAINVTYPGPYAGLFIVIFENGIVRLTAATPRFKRAKVEVARKLALILHPIWEADAPFRWSEAAAWSQAYLVLALHECVLAGTVGVDQAAPWIAARQRPHTTSADPTIQRQHVVASSADSGENLEPGGRTKEEALTSAIREPAGTRPGPTAAKRQ